MRLLSSRMPNDDRVDRHGLDNFFNYFFRRERAPGVRAAHLTRPPAAATPTRVLIAVGEESLGTFTGPPVAFASRVR
jgi:hypothetical protein